MQDQTMLPPTALPAVSIEPTPTIPPVAGFWYRLAAWFIDSLILGLIGQIVALALSSLLFQIGPYGRPIGWLLILPYFGILNSRIGGGQTVGKRVLKIAVRNGANEPIGLARSLGRIALLTLPNLFNGWALPIFELPVLAWVVSLLVFGLGGAIFYTMVFNRKTRQGIHDLVFGTYVVHLVGNPILALPQTARIHRLVVGAWIALVAVAMLVLSVLTPSIVSSEPMASVLKVHGALKSDERFFSASVMDSVSFVSNQGSSHTLVINVWYRGNPGNDEKEAIIASVVRTAFDHAATTIDTYDGIRVTVTSAYDIGVASATLSMTVTQSIDEWRQKLGLDRP